MEKIDEQTFSMTNDKFKNEMQILFEAEEFLNYNNDIFDKKEDKPRIAIIYDRDGWAFHNIAKEIKNRLSSYYHIDIISSDIFENNIMLLLLLAPQYDLMHCMWRGLISLIESEDTRQNIANWNIKYEDFIKKYLQETNITTCVNDHLFLNKEQYENTKVFTKYVKNYTVSSSILMNIYNKLDIVKKPQMIVNDGVDTEKFKPINIERFELDNINNRKIKIGWVGNSEFIDSEGDSDLKGVKNIIKPAIEELIADGVQIEMKFADRKYGYISHEKMPQYYSEIDIYVCASKTEGTPDPILEAMACGVPIISSNVGIVEEALGSMQKKFILKDRSKEELKNKIIELVNNRQMFKDLSNENIKQSKEWSWAKKSKLYKDFFDQNLNKWRK